MIPGIANRLEKELEPLGNNKWDARVTAPEYRKYFTWRGGSVLAPMLTYVTRNDFEDMPSIVNQ